MTYPWASSDVLTAADLNAYAGLVFIKSQTIGSGVSSVTVTGAFSSTFDNYKITVDGHVSSASTGLNIALGSSATSSGYYGSKYYDYYGGSSTGADRYVATTSIGVAQITTFAENSVTIEVHQPYLAARTQFMADGYGNGYSTWMRGTQASSTSFTAFTLSPSSGTLTGGTIRVYGYNNG